jgi:prepilin-type N-terminal cleavage/methylation domain-containing protein
MKKHKFRFDFMSRTNARKCGFTLVELLVVIGIIILLAGLALPGVMKARDMVRVTKAKRTVKMIKAAIDGYHMEYERLPVPRNIQLTRDTYKADDDNGMNHAIIQVLQGTNRMSGVENPDERVFLDVPESEVGDKLLDPWENGFLLLLDADYNGKITYLDDEDLRLNAAVISYGADGEVGTRDDLYSYK